MATAVKLGLKRSCPAVSQICVLHFLLSSDVYWRTNMVDRVKCSKDSKANMQIQWFFSFSGLWQSKTTQSSVLLVQGYKSRSLSFDQTNMKPRHRLKHPVTHTPPTQQRESSQLQNQSKPTKETNKDHHITKKLKGHNTTGLKVPQPKKKLKKYLS